MSEYKTFGEMTKEERSELVEAALAGFVIERMDPFDGEWLECGGGQVYIHFDFRFRYRTAPTKPSIDWSHVHPDYKWLATDVSGRSFLYESKPEYDADGYFRSRDAYARADLFSSFKPGTCKPEDSLVMRPEDV